MNDDDRIVRRGPFKGKKIEFASTTGVDLFEEISREFMFRVFGFEPGDYLITDESSLQDFAGVEDMQLADILAKVQRMYGVDVSDVDRGRLLEVFIRVHDHSMRSRDVE